MASVVDICNKALSLLGQRTIVSLDDDSPEALACRIHWEPLRDEVLRSHPWNCASKRASLNRLLETPAYDYDYYYQLPTDCLMVRNVEPEGHFELEGRKLLSGSNAISILYTAANDDTTEYDSQLAAGLSYKLAAELAYQMTKSNSLAQQLDEKGNEKIADAKSSDSIEGKRPDRRSRNWLSAHYGR